MSSKDGVMGRRGDGLSMRPVGLSLELILLSTALIFASCDRASEGTATNASAIQGQMLSAVQAARVLGSDANDSQSLFDQWGSTFALGGVTLQSSYELHLLSMSVGPAQIRYLIESASE